jgi:hypothetical protein
LITISLTGAAFGETTSEDLAKESKEACKAQRVDKKNEALAHGKALLKKTDTEIDKLQAQADEASDDANVAYEEEIDNLAHMASPVQVAATPRLRSKSPMAAPVRFSSAPHG